MDTKKRYVKLEDLEVYQLSRELSRIGWEIYEKLSWQEKKVIGDQFIIWIGLNFSITQEVRLQRQFTG